MCCLSVCFRSRCLTSGWRAISPSVLNVLSVCLFQISMPHQWMEGNLPVSAKCVVCDKTCGSVLRLQDWRCLWCRAMVSNNRVVFRGGFGGVRVGGSGQRGKHFSIFTTIHVDSQYPLLLFFHFLY